LTSAPASTGSATPVMYRASSEARNRTALLMSTGSTHGIGSAFSVSSGSVRSSAVGCSRSGRNSRYDGSFCTIGVLTVVGQIALTRMKSAASSSASVRIKPITPCFAAV
jgi:hypothetical protein